MYTFNKKNKSYGKRKHNNLNSLSKNLFSTVKTNSSKWFFKSNFFVYGVIIVVFLVLVKMFREFFTSLPFVGSLFKVADSASKVLDNALGTIIPNDITTEEIVSIQNYLSENNNANVFNPNRGQFAILMPSNSEFNTLSNKLSSSMNMYINYDALEAVFTSLGSKAKIRGFAKKWNSKTGLDYSNTLQSFLFDNTFNWQPTFWLHAHLSDAGAIRLINKINSLKEY